MAPAKRPRLFHLLNQARRALLGRANAELVDALDLTVSQLVALFHLVEHGRSRATELASALELDAAAVTRLVARLERKELVALVRNERDARSRWIEITPAGRERAKRGYAILAEANRELAAGFTEAEIDTVARFLHHAIALGKEGTE